MLSFRSVGPILFNGATRTLDGDALSARLPFRVDRQTSFQYTFDRNLGEGRLTIVQGYNAEATMRIIIMADSFNDTERLVHPAIPVYRHRNLESNQSILILIQ